MIYTLNRSAFIFFHSFFFPLLRFFFFFGDFNGRSCNFHFFARQYVLCCADVLCCCCCCYLIRFVSFLQIFLFFCAFLFWMLKETVLKRTVEYNIVWPFSIWCSYMSISQSFFGHRFYTYCVMMLFSIAAHDACIFCMCWWPSFLQFFFFFSFRIFFFLCKSSFKMVFYMNSGRTTSVKHHTPNTKRKKRSKKYILDFRKHTQKKGNTKNAK